MDLPNNNAARALKALKTRLKSSAVLTDAKSLFDAGIDHTRYSFIPQAAIKIGLAADVGEVLKTANEYGVKVSPRGSGTGCSGGALAQRGGWVIDLSALKSIKIDPAAWIAEVEAGAITADVDAAAHPYGLFYPPDPSSHKYSSIGGNIACNAGGLRAAKYGVTRDYVLALEGYLPSGAYVRWGRPIKKFSVGLNMRDLWIGSEGLLGIVTKAWLKLAKRPEAVKTYMFLYDGELAAISAVQDILQGGTMPAILEFMDSETVACARRYCESLAVKEGFSALLVQLDGAPSEIAAAEPKLLESARKRAVSFKTAASGAEAEALWSMRRKCSQAMYEIADSKLSQDIVLPLGSTAEFFEFFKRDGKECGIPTPTFGHAADGNYHIHAMYKGADSLQTKAARGIMDRAILKAVALGGAVSGEHGIGILKTHYMKYQHSAAELEAMRAVKRALDPNDILNSGKVLEEFDIGSAMPLKDVHLPWDK